MQTKPVKVGEITHENPRGPGATNGEKRPERGTIREGEEGVGTLRMTPLLLDERRSIATTIVWGTIISSLSFAAETGAAAETARSIRPSGAETMQGTETAPAPVTGTATLNEGSNLLPLFRR